MSHFTCLVIGPDHEAQLQPFHEFECTGTDDKYVQSIDKIDEYRERFSKETTTRLQDANGVLHSYFDDKGEWKPEFSQPDTDNFGLQRRKKFVPPGFTEVEVPASTVESFAEWIEGWAGLQAVPFGQEPDLEGEHKYGYVLLNEAGEVTKAIDRTNPNKRWDWYEIGGRWTGFFKLKEGATGVLGRPGLMTRAAEPDRADQALKGAIDFEGIRQEKADKAAALWDKAHAITGGERWESWDSVRERLGTQKIEEARTFYHVQAALKSLKESKDDAFSWEVDDALSGPRDAYVQSARDRAISTFAVVYRGEWTERGRMGWFGFSDDKIDDKQWSRLFNELIDGLPDDTLLTVVDCHI